MQARNLNALFTFICLRATLSYDVAHRAVRSWRQNSFGCFSRWPWNTLRNRMCGVDCCGKEWGGSEIMIVDAIRWGAWYYTVVLNVCQTYKWSRTFIIKDGRYIVSLLVSVKKKKNSLSSAHVYNIWCSQFLASSYDSNKSTKRCNSFTSLLLDVYVWLNMFRALPRPSSGAYNCTRSLWI
jgi:hypothetical protein